MNRRQLFIVVALTVTAAVAGLLRADGLHAQDATPSTADCPVPTRDEMQALAERYGDAWNAGDSSAFAAVLADDYVHHWNIGNDAESAEAFQDQIDFFLGAFENLKVTVDDILVDGDKAAIRWTAE